LRRYRCRECGKTFNERTETPLTRLRTPIKDVIEAIQMYCSGMGEADIARIKGVTEKTVNNWTWKIISHCLRFNGYFLDKRNHKFNPVFIQFDEMWGYAGKKKNRQWVWDCIDTFSRLLIGFIIGKRGRKSAEKMVKLVKSRININPPIITSDGLERYTEVIPKRFRRSFYAQVIKIFRKNRVIGVTVRVIRGTKEKITQMINSLGRGKMVNIAYIERLHLTVRHCVNCLGRRVLFFAKNRLEMIGRMHVFQAFYNFVRTHMSLRIGKERRTPAMAAGLTDHVWTWYELLTHRIY
jgi:IS1 family transposase